MFKFSSSSLVISPSTPQYFAGHGQRKEKSTGVHARGIHAPGRTCS